MWKLTSHSGALVLKYHVLESRGPIVPSVVVIEFKIMSLELVNSPSLFWNPISISMAVSFSFLTMALTLSAQFLTDSSEAIER